MSGFEVFSIRKDLDALFQPRIASDPSAQLVPFETPTGQNLSERYLPYTSGTKVNPTGFNVVDTSGNIWDLSDYFSRVLTLGWSGLGGGADLDVYAIYAADASNIYVGGTFASVYSSGTNTVPGTSRIAKWNGSSWSALRGGANFFVYAIYALDTSNIYVGGDFSTVYNSIGTNSVPNTRGIAKWNGSSWSAVDSGANSAVYTIGAVNASNVYIGGSFTRTDASYNYIAKWNGTNSWSALGGGANSVVYAIYALDASNIYVGGAFSSVYSSGTTGVARTLRIAKWSAPGWGALGGGAQAAVNAIYALDASNVYVGGDFTTVYDASNASIAGTVRIAKWNAITSTWSALGRGAQNSVRTIYAVDASNIYVGGDFTTVYDASNASIAGTSRIAKWNGNSWSAIGSGANNTVNAIDAVDASNVYVGGLFTRTDAAYNYIARWGILN